METVYDRSYGVIPVRLIAGSYEILLIHQISRRGDTYWTLPKGHPEPAENAHTCATRELKEETDLVPLQLLQEPSLSVTYHFFHQDRKVEKTVTYFIGFISPEAIPRPQTGEVIELEFMTFAEALKRVTFDNTRMLIEQAQRYLQSLT